MQSTLVLLAAMIFGSVLSQDPGYIVQPSCTTTADCSTKLAGSVCNTASGHCYCPIGFTNRAVANKTTCVLTQCESDVDCMTGRTTETAKQVLCSPEHYCVCKSNKTIHDGLDCSTTSLLPGIIIGVVVLLVFALAGFFTWWYLIREQPQPDPTWAQNPKTGPLKSGKKPPPPTPVSVKGKGQKSSTSAKSKSKSKSASGVLGSKVN